MKTVDLSGMVASPLFKGMDAQEIEILSGYFTAHQVPEGKTVFVENMAGESLYLIAEGGVAISQMLGERNEQGMVVLGPGEAFGELAVFDTGGRQVSARVTKETLLYGLKRRDFLTLTNDNPRLGIKLTLNL
ncbi:MAG: hypothetical protein C0622_07100, partial [Desulfuromonas sp.]